jgi:alpha-beta hydrolase superfamily lysophospholipase
MSRQNKAIKKRAEAKQWTKIRKDGGKGPARTTPKHGKVKTQKVIKAEELRKANEKAAAEAQRAAQKAADKAAEAKKKPAAKKAPLKKAA